VSRGTPALLLLLLVVLAGKGASLALEGGLPDQEPLMSLEEFKKNRCN
jgi:hypothetical protein